MKRPAFQFYPADWFKDPGLRSCSLAARGLWIDMIALMHQADPYGHLVVNSRPVESAALARMTGSSTREVDQLLGELGGAGVFSRDDSGAIYSRRMVRDEDIRERRAAGGRLGGNPNLAAASKVSNKVNLPVNLKPTPSSSSSSSVDPSPSGIPSPPSGGSGKARKRATAFTKPSLDDIRAYCAERHNTVDASGFLDHYTANGWRVGKNPMRDWQAAVRTWERNSVGRINGTHKPTALEQSADALGLTQADFERAFSRAP